jgi:predicted N-acetyltransferase YhbS
MQAKRGRAARDRASVADRPSAERGSLAARPCLREALAVAALVAVATLAVLVTYTRVEPEELYNVSVDGLAGGFGRTLVLLNYPVALVAIAFAALAADRLARRPFDAVAIVAVALSALVVVPGVVDQGDLDARPVNALPALGVLLVALLVAAAVREGGVGESLSRLPTDRLRLALAAALAVLGIPWFFAELGFYAPDPILADEVPPGESITAVHLGHHHGTDGVLLGLAALALSRALPTLRRPRLTAALSGYLALMLAYGVAIAVEDEWHEQVAKRDWTEWKIPNLLRPEPTLWWAGIVAAAVAVELLWFRRERAAYR